MVGETINPSGPNPREHAIIQLVAEGCKNREIADSLGTTEYVIKNYLRVIYDKLGLWKALAARGRAINGLRLVRCDDEFYAVLTEGAWLESKVSEGGTSSPRVREQVAAARAVLDDGAAG